MPRKRRKTPPEIRFWKHVQKTEACWLWLGALAGSMGYGGINVGGVKIRAHRFSYELHRKKIPAGKFVLHRCDNPLCVNPDHLYLGTKKKNSLDCKLRKRMHFQVNPKFAARGIQCEQAKLTEKIVKELRLRRSNGESYFSMAKSYGVTRSTIRRAVLGIQWAHVK